METEKRAPDSPTSPTLQSRVEGQKRRRFRNWKIVLPSFVLGLLALAFFLWPSSHGRARTLDGIDIVSVPVVRVSRDDLVRTVTFEAELRPYQAIDLHANVAGFVQSIKVEIGDQVRAGEVLATLRIPELKEELDRATALEARNENKVKEADAAHEDAHLAYGRLISVDERRPHLIAKQDLDSAQAKDRAMEAALAAAKQEVEVSKAELNRLKAIFQDCQVTAPFSGVITKRYADEGALVQGGVNPSGAAMPLVRLSQNDRLRLDFPVSISYVSQVKVGDNVQIKIGATGQTMPGKISRFARNVDMATRTMETEVDLPNPDLSLTPGIYAEVTLPIETRSKVLAVPEQAIPNAKIPTAYVVNSQHQIEERALKIGLATPEEFEVLSGLNENDMVMVGSREQVKPGQKVEPVFAGGTGL